MSCMCVSFNWRVFLTVLYFRKTYCTPVQSLYSIHAHAVQALKVGAISCSVKYITLSVLSFFQVWENTQWIMDGFAWGRMCARYVDIDHSSTKALSLAQEWSPPRLCHHHLPPFSPSHSASNFSLHSSSLLLVACVFCGPSPSSFTFQNITVK